MKNANKLFNVVARFASFDVRVALCVPAFIGCYMVLFGCAMEQSFQHNLLVSGGMAALDAYKAMVGSHQLSVLAFMVDSVTGNCFAHSALVQGIGFWLVFVLTPLVGVLMLFARLAVSKSFVRFDAELI